MPPLSSRMQRQPDGMRSKRSGNLEIYADNGDLDGVHVFRVKRPGRARLLEALGERDVACIAHTVDFATLSNQNLQAQWNATMVTSDEIARALREDERERTVFSYLWLAVRKLVGLHVYQRGLYSTHSPGLREDEIDRRAAYYIIASAHERLSVDSNTIVIRARRIVACFVDMGRAQDQVVISIPATTEGIGAGQILHADHGTLVNLTHVTGPDHAAACAAAGPDAVTLLLPVCVEPLSALYCRVSIDSMIVDRPGSHGQNKVSVLPLKSVALMNAEATAHYFRTHGIPTLLIGGALAHVDDSCALSSLDALTFSAEQAFQAEFYIDYPALHDTQEFGTRMHASTLRVEPEKMLPRQRKGKIYDVMQLAGSGAAYGLSCDVPQSGYDSICAI
ncbi:hypothetical protein PENSPDRAFT_680912 [Peniophora sp. CONT]|nr:hypothetical protein PENSPDRAFT_680912 [Peniophora sp. CONT]